MRFVIVLLLAACGTHEEAPPPPERFRPEGFDVRVQGERMHATTTEPDRCRELVEPVRSPAVRNQLLSERVLVVGCADRWLRLDIDVQGGEAEVVGGAPENHDVVMGAKWRLDHAEAHDLAREASFQLAKCTTESEMTNVPDALACIEQRLPVGQAAFDALVALGPPESDVCEWNRRKDYAELTADAIRAGRAPRRFRDSEQLASALRRFDSQRYERVANAPFCTPTWYFAFQDFSCVNVVRDIPIPSVDMRCTYERAAAALVHGYAPTPGYPRPPRTQ